MSLVVREHGKAGRVAATEALIVGGGHAGMLAVQALLGRAGKITVVERDRYPDAPVFRAGVPQARHLHGLAYGGQRALENLLPGIMPTLMAAGARLVVPPRDVVVHTASGWHHRFGFTRFPMVSCTRPLLDFVVRTRVLAEAAGSATQVEVLEGTEVTGLAGASDRVTGARVRSRGADQPERELSADLVVDASGRGSRAPKWFEALGLPAPAEEIVDAQLAYATRLYRFPVEPDDGVLLQPEPQLRRGGVLMPVEDGRWLVTLSGFTGIRPPTDEDTFLDYAATLAHPHLHRVLKTAEPLSPVYGFLDTSNRRRRYERRGAAPDGFVAVGDAAASFDPVYGQGMTAGALHAVALRDAVAKDGLRRGLSASAQRAIARASAMPWRTATAVDRAYLKAAADEAGNTASASMPERLSQWFNERLLGHATTNERVAEVVHGVYQLALPPARLLSPAVILRILLMSPVPGHAEPPAHVFEA
jgi:2-polyprenyl-6-methoxyphenol hydroxylase-like FAD-dependent oxidoreductase